MLVEWSVVEQRASSRTMAPRCVTGTLVGGPVSTRINRAFLIRTLSVFAQYLRHARPWHERRPSMSRYRGASAVKGSHPEETPRR